MDRIKAVYERLGMLVAGQLNRYEMRPEPGAQAIYRELVDEIQERDRYGRRTDELAEDASKACG
jgi:hypothetical protein